MSVLNIIKVPDSVLRTKSKKILKIDKELQKLILNMAETVESYQTETEAGVAMAAIQVGKPIRLVVLKEDDGNFAALINPEITKKSGKESEDLEGCLSVPGIYGYVKRFEKIEVTGIDMDNNKFGFEASGLLARILQHEIDHLEGILFTDRITDLDKIYKLDKKGRLVTNKGEIVDEKSTSGHKEY